MHNPSRHGSTDHLSHVVVKGFVAKVGTNVDQREIHGGRV
jgi:hypothetical protein